MAHELLITPRYLYLGAVVQAAGGGARAAQRQGPQRILQPLGESDKAPAAEDEVDMLGARACQPKVVQPRSDHGTGETQTPSILDRGCRVHAPGWH